MRVQQCQSNTSSSIVTYNWNHSVSTQWLKCNGTQRNAAPSLPHLRNLFPHFMRNSDAVERQLDWPLSARRVLMLNKTTMLATDAETQTAAQIFRGGWHFTVLSLQISHLQHWVQWVIHPSCIHNLEIIRIAIKNTTNKRIPVHKCSLNEMTHCKVWYCDIISASQLLWGKKLFISYIKVKELCSLHPMTSVYGVPVIFVPFHSRLRSTDNDDKTVPCTRTVC